MKRLLLLLLLVLGAGLVFWLTRGAGGDGGELGVAGREGQASGSEDAEPPRAAVEAPRAARSVLPAGEGSASASEEAAAPAAAPTEADGRLRCRLRTEDGEPVAGVRVLFVAVGEGMPFPAVIDQASSGEEGLVVFEEVELPLEDVPEEFTLGLEVDLPLEPKVERPLRAADLVAAARGEVFELTLPAGAKELGGPLRVQVVDAGGAPAFGVEVAYRLQQRSASDSGDDLVRAATEPPDGVARLDREEEARLRSYLAAGRTPFERIVTCRGPLLDPPSRVLPAGSFEQPVVLRLGPTFALDVELVGPDGERITEGGAVQLSWTLPGEEQRDGFRWLTLEEGRTSVDHLSCGLGISLGASVRDSLFRGVSYELTEEPVPGERIAVTLRFEDEFPVLAGRLLDEAGEPLADTPFTLELFSEVPPPNAHGPVRFGGSFGDTGAEGTFALPWGQAGYEPPGSGARLMRFVERAGRAGAPTGWSARYAQVPAPGFRDGETRYALGDVRLAPMPLLVSGIVVDEVGAPVRGAIVHVRYAVGEGERAQWYNHSDRYTTEADGRFELRTFHEYEAVRVSASKIRGGGSGAVEVPVGARDVRLVFLPPEPEGERGEVRGRLLADEAIPWAGLTVELRQSDSGRESRRESMVFAGRYAFDRVPPGTYTLEVVAGGYGFEGPDFSFASESDVIVRAGETTTPPDLDLRGRLRLFELRCLDSGGEPLDRVSCHVETDLARHPSGWIHDGRFAFVAPSALDAFQFAADGFEPVVVRYTGEPQTLQLLRR